MQLKLWALPILLLINISYGAGFMNNKGMYVSTQAEEEKRYQENPNPKKLYRVTINIENAPSEFEKIYTSANYQSTNCRYLKKGFAGATDQPYHTIHLESKKISETQYQTEFYVDGMLDEDYGYGSKKEQICHWELQNVSIIFKATGAKGETRFSASVDGNDLNKKHIEKNHLKDNFPINGRITNYLSQGGLKKELFTPDEYFTFYINFEEVK